jgi:pimeloyl-ACP methyl ester carboxylesterase
MRAALPAALSADPAVAEPALRAFVTDMATVDLPGSLFDESRRVPAFVRAALFDRDVTSVDVLAAVDVPTLVVHGRQDRVVDPSAAEYAAALIPGATLTWLDTGHAPFLEGTAFDIALAEHADRCFGRVA